MNKNIEEFKSKNEPKYKLRKYEDEIIHLLKEGYTQTQIFQYLKEFYLLEVSRQTLSTHLKFLKTIEPKKQKFEEKKVSESEKKGSNFLGKKISPDEFMDKLSGNA